jgi:phage N-6-adenine-methyltransferase
MTLLTSVSSPIRSNGPVSTNDSLLHTQLTVSSLAAMPVARLVELGKQAIMQAGSFEELREIRNKAEALRTYQRAQGAALDAINAATQLRVRADRRMGEALAEMQKNEGGRPRESGDTTSPVPDVPTYAQLGIDKKQASRWQGLAGIGSEMFEAILEEHERQGAPVTTANVMRAAERAKQLGQSAQDIRNAPVPTSEARERTQARFWSEVDRASSRELLVEKYTGEYEWNTPPEILEAAREVLGEFDLDPASNPTAQRTVRARHYFTKEEDGLARPWTGRVWMNPPYAQGLIDPFVTKLLEHVKGGEVTEAILLVDNRTDTRWFQTAVRAAPRICFTSGRLRFLRPRGEAAGTPINGSALLYYGDQPERFARVFDPVGVVLRRD